MLDLSWFTFEGFLQGALILYGCLDLACRIPGIDQFFFPKTETETVGNRDNNNNNPEEIDRVQSDVATRKDPNLWNTAIFFPDLDHLLDASESPTSRLIQLIRGAKMSIRICMFCLSYEPLLKEVRMKNKEGMMVKVISNRRRRFGGTIHSKVYIPPQLELNNKNGAMKRLYLMHNKFVIIDDEAVMTGSLNWTSQGVLQNQENVLVSTDPRHVKPFLDEFAKLWTKSKEC